MLVQKLKDVPPFLLSEHSEPAQRYPETAIFLLILLFDEKKKVMKNLIIGVSAAALMVGAAGAAGADPAYQHTAYGDRGSQHADWGHDQGANHRWNRGENMGRDDWNNAQPVDYRAHHLRRPPHGYAWRESNGQFILAAVATGVVASIILDHNR
jgi:Ni/Co efflux regulator RcnB